MRIRFFSAKMPLCYPSLSPLSSFRDEGISEASLPEKEASFSLSVNGWMEGRTKIPVDGSVFSWKCQKRV